MKVLSVFMTMVLMVCKKSHSIDVSSIDCGDGCSAIDGSSYTLTCKWSGTLQTGIVWTKDGMIAVICNTTDCGPTTPGYASGSYVNSQTAQMTITSFSNTDVGTWECSDSPGQPKSCSLRQLEKRNIKLEAMCSTRTVTCKLDDHGTPPITLGLMDETVSTNSSGVLTMSASVGVKTCAVTGEGSQCASTTQMTVACYGIGPPVAAIVVVLIGVITVIVLLVLIMNGSLRQMELVFYVFEVILIIIALVFIIVLFVLYTDYVDALFIVAVVIVFAGLIVAIVAFIIHRLLQ